VEETEIPFKNGTKKFLIAQRLVEGRDYDQIEKDLHVKRGTIYSVKSVLKKEYAKQPNPTPQLGETHQLGEIHQGELGTPLVKVSQVFHLIQRLHLVRRLTS
jgi:hypothetical protein